MRAPAFALAALVPLAAAAESSVTKRYEPAAAADDLRNWGNLRIGGAVGAGDGRPEICGEFLPFAFLSVEACGSGAGILHDEPIQQAMHVRAKVSPWRLRAGDLRLEPLVGAGMIELQVGRDAPGLRFSDTGPDRLETAGLEAMAGLRVLLPVGGGFELVGELSGGLGYTPHAPDLRIPYPVVPAFASFTIGMGF